MSIRRLRPDDAAAYQRVRLRALKEHPEAFGQSVADFEQLTLEQLAARLEDSATGCMFGAFVVGELIGTIYIGFTDRVKTRHRAHIAAMYVMQPHQGQGFGRQLLAQALQHARDAWPHVEDVVLAVTAGNVRAKGLYEAYGFDVWGYDPRYLKLEDGTYYDLEWMICKL